MKIFYYLKIWWLLSVRSFLSVLSQKGNFVIFFVGKLLRFVIYAAFLIYLVSGTQELAGYTVHQVLFFYLTFNLVDVIAQFLFREVYRFRPQVVSGGFDLILTKPMSSLFRSLVSGADLIDLATIPLLVIAIVATGSTFNPGLGQVLAYVLLIVNGIVIAAAFHITVLSFAIITLEIDHTVMIYRDVVSLGRLPLDIYQEPLRSVLTFIIPVAIMIWLPARMIMGIGSLQTLILAVVGGFISIFLSLRLWKYALSKYASASS